MTAKKHSRRRAFQPGVERCEDRVVMAALLGVSILSKLAATVGKAITSNAGKSTGKFIVEQTATAPAQALLGAAMSLIGLDFGGNSDAGFSEVKKEIDALSTQIGDLKSELGAKIDNVAVQGLVGPLDLPKLNSAAETLKVAVSQKTAADRLKYLSRFQTEMAPLASSVYSFEAAFQGQGFQNDLMQVYQPVIERADMSLPSDPFLTSAYSTQMNKVYDYFKDYEDRAVDLVVEYDFSEGYDGLAASTTNEALQNYSSDKGTLPGTIPTYAHFDTRSGLLWGTGLGAGWLDYDRANTVFPNVLNGRDNFAGLEDNNCCGQYNTAWAKVDFDLIKKETGFPAPWRWSLPTPEIFTSLGSGLGSGNVADTLVKDGFAGATYYLRTTGRASRPGGLEAKLWNFKGGADNFQWNPLNTWQPNITALYDATPPGGTAYAQAKAWMAIVNTSTLAVTGTTSGGQETLTATFTSPATEAPISGATINFTLNGVTVGTAETDAKGIATLSEDLPGGTKGSPIVASFTGTKYYATASATGTLA